MSTHMPTHCREVVVRAEQCPHRLREPRAAHPLFLKRLIPILNAAHPLFLKRLILNFRALKIGSLVLGMAHMAAA